VTPVRPKVSGVAALIRLGGTPDVDAAVSVVSLTSGSGGLVQHVAEGLPLTVVEAETRFVNECLATSLDDRGDLARELAARSLSACDFEVSFARLGRDHRHLAVLVDRHDVSVRAARSKPTQDRLLLDDDRVGIRVRLDFEALLELGLQERVESILPSTRRIDLSSHHAYPSSLRT
jgi:hypothetical protein